MQEQYAFEGDFVDSGWVRWLPQSAYFLHMGFVTLAVNEIDGDIGERPPGEAFSNIVGVVGGLDADVWESEEAELARHPRDTDAAALLQRAKERLKRAADAADMTVITNRDLIELMRRFGLIRRIEVAGRILWRPVSPLPLPDERLPMLPIEKRDEDLIRWHGLHEKNAHKIIARFVEENLSTLRTTLRALANDLRLDPESVRHATDVLVSEGAFNADVDLERASIDREFDLAFDSSVENRIEIHQASTGGG
jgi:hypothetical protein